MKKNLLAIIFASFCAGTLSAQNIAWPEVTTEAKPGARWWWMGSAVGASIFQSRDGHDGSYSYLWGTG